MKNPIKSKIPVFVAAALLTSNGLLQAAPTVYEPFNYSVGVLTGKNGGVGFSGGWVASRGTSQQGGVWDEITNATFPGESPALIWNGVLNNSFPTFPTTGARYAGPTNSGSSDQNISRPLAASAAAMAGTDGVLWLSAVYHVANSGSGAGINIGLGNGYVYDRGRYFSITPSGSASTSVSYIGVNGYTGSAWNSRVNPMVTGGSWTAGQYAWTAGNTALSTSADMIVMLKFTFGTSDKVEAAYFTENETPSETSFDTKKVSATYANGIDENALTVLSVSQGRMANAIDEIRIGKTFEDVTSASPNFEYDEWAMQYPGLGLPGDDNDSDGLANNNERLAGTNPLLADTDGDSYSDGAEATAGSNPKLASSTPLNTDADGLPDAWEITHFGNLSHDGTADSDNDLLIDSLEFTMGFNPSNPDTDGDGNKDWMGIPGYLYVEQWNNVPGSNVEDLLNSTAFRGQSNDVYLVTQAKAQSNVGDDYGLRMTGRVIAPVTGAYHFWIAGDGACRLYLSSDSTAFKRSQIASVKVGSGEEQWDFDPAQKSAAINLVAGQEYFIEALMKESSGADHLALAWDYPGQARQIIPGARLKSYVVDAGDTDADGMLDAWETSMGLNASDNGSSTPGQGAYDDPDGDGLLNFEEYNLSGNPLVAGGNAGYLELDVWKNITGSTVKDLIGNSKYTSAPDSKLFTGADVSGLGLNYGARLRGSVTAPQTGDYVFTIAGDEQAELWISSTDSPFAKRKVAYSTTKTNPQQWLAGTRQSGGIHFEEGKSYYIEALVKNGSGTDHLSIGWSRIAENEWQVSDIGSGTTSAWSVNSSTGNVHGTTTGGDIRYTTDKCTFRYVQLQGDCEMTARIPALDSPNAAAKAGLMIRESLAADSTFGFMHLTKDGRLALHQRSASGGQTAQVGSLGAGQPYQWLRINRTGNVMTGYYSLDGLSWKQLGTCTIAMGQSVYVGMATASTITNVAVSADWDHIGFSDLSRVSLIPSSALTSFTPSTLDQDEDGLPDAWETANGLSASTGANGNGQYGDLDGDGLSNFDEYLLGSNPLSTGGIAGGLTRELWPSLTGDSIREVVTSTAFLQGSGQVELLTAAEQITLGNTSGIQRVRGGVVAPVTGNYRFWISGYSDCELWFNDKGPSKFGKRRLAWLNEHALDGPYLVGFRGWDTYATQISEWVHLQAGQRYFIEVLQKHSQGSGHFSIAWSYTDANGQNTPRGLIPAAQLRSFEPDSDDVADDYMPDSWQATMGLNPADNGLVDRLLEGEYGDKDGDGLTNREEYLYGTNPNDPDSDHDGLSDFVEVHNLGSDPNSGDSGFGNVIASLQGSEGTGTTSQWIAGPDGSLLSLDRRGACTWPFSLTEPGIKILEVMAMAQGNTWAGGTLELDVAIVRASDSKRLSVGSYPVYDNDGESCQILAILPQLAAGSYLAEITVRNVSESRSIRIDRVRIIEATGADTNANGNADWLETRISQSNGVLTGATSAISPACVEGVTRDVATSWMQSGSNQISLTPGIDNRWFANISLPADGSTLPMDAYFEDGTYTMSSPVSWSETNVMQGGVITVRNGDSLRLTAYPGNTPVDGNVTITGAGEPINTTANTPVVRSFVMANWAQATKGSVATQSGTASNASASLAIDGNVNGLFAKGSVTQTNNVANSWWQVDFGQPRDVQSVVLWNRTDTNTLSRLSNFRISLQDASGNEVIGQDFYPSGTGNVGVSMTWELPQTVQASILRISLLGLNNAGNGYLSLAEVQAFPPKTLTLNATHTTPEGAVSTGSMTVNVVSADFGPNLMLRSGRSLDWSLPGVAYQLPLEFDAKLKAEELGPDQNAHKLRVATTSDKPVRLVARSAVGAPIVGVGTVDPYQIGDIYDSGYVEILDTLPDGTLYGRISVVADRLPPGGYVQIQIWAGGAQFADGTSLKNLTAADFDENGVAYVDVYYPANAAISSFCHYTRLYSADGTLLSGY